MANRELVGPVGMVLSRCLAVRSEAGPDAEGGVQMKGRPSHPYGRHHRPRRAAVAASAPVGPRAFTPPRPTLAVGQPRADTARGMGNAEWRAGVFGSRTGPAPPGR